MPVRPASVIPGLRMFGLASCLAFLGPDCNSHSCRLGTEGGFQIEILANLQPLGIAEAPIWGTGNRFSVFVPPVCRDSMDSAIDFHVEGSRVYNTSGAAPFIARARSKAGRTLLFFTGPGPENSR